MKEETLQELKKKSVESANKHKKIRDKLNGEVGKFIASRNTANKQVRDMIAIVQRQKVIRDKANLEVREAKKIRRERTADVKSHKKSSVGQEVTKEWDRVIEAQNQAHEMVVTAAKTAQDAHDSMIRISAEVDRLRAKADERHKEVRKAKREADRAHRLYIVSRRCQNSVKDILRHKQAHKSEEE